MTHKGMIIVGLLAMLVCLSSSDYAGLSFKLTRFDDDKFENPTAKACDWTNQQFCKDANSRCDGDCCRCTCDYQTSTFDRKEMKCVNNDEFRKGCSLKFDGKYGGHQIKALDLAKLGEAKIYWPVHIWTDVVKSFNIISIAFYHDGSEAQNKFLTKKGNVDKRNGNWEVTVKWDPVSKDYHGQLFKVNVSYIVERSLRGGIYLTTKNDCFVFKSSGSVTVTFPSPTTPTLPPSTTEESTTASTAPPSTSTAPPSTSTAPPSTSTTPPSTSTTSSSSTVPSRPGKPTTLPDTQRPPVTTQESKQTRKPTDLINTLAARNKGSGGEGEENNAMTVSLAVVGCLLLLVVVVLVVLLLRRRSSRTSQGKNNGTVDANRNANNAMMMCQVEGIYAEADNPVNYPPKGTNNVVYDNGRRNVESGYASLDMTKVESKPIYQSLINEQGNLYEQIPANCNNKSFRASGLTGGAPLAEPFYHTVDEQPQDPSQIYHLPDEPQETVDCMTRGVPGRIVNESPAGIHITGGVNPKKVSNVPENGSSEADYLTILPATSDYEQPVDPPVPDA